MKGSCQLVINVGTQLYIICYIMKRCKLARDSLSTIQLTLLRILLPAASSNIHKASYSPFHC